MIGEYIPLYFVPLSKWERAKRKRMRKRERDGAYFFSRALFPTEILEQASPSCSKVG